MMNYRVAFLVLMLVAGAVAHADELYSLPLFDLTETTIVIVDPATGNADEVIRTSRIFPGPSTADRIGGRIFVQSTDAIYTFNVRTGAVTSAPFAFTPEGAPMIWDPVGNQLLSVGFFGQPTVAVVRIDPATGAVTRLIETGTGTAESLALDAAGRRLFFGTNIGDLFATVNLATLTMTTRGFFRFSGELFFDAAQDRLIGIGSLDDVSLGATLYVFIDPGTGAVTSFHSTGSPTRLLTNSAFDPVTRRLYFQDDPAFGNLFTIQVDTGVVTSVRFSRCCGPLYAIAAAAPVPLSDGALLLLMLSVAGAGVMVIARR